MRYKAARTDIIDPEIGSPEWDRAELGHIDINRWREYVKAPDTTFMMLRGPQGISVLMHTEEKNLRAECDTQNGDVYTDSCMEFFIKPDSSDERYLNFEFNPKGVLHLGLGSGRQERRLLDTNRKVFSIVSYANEGDWTLKFYIPDSFLEEHFKNVSTPCKGNLYKCGDMTDHVHYAVWSEVEVDAPDYHRPEFFGTIEL